MIANIIIMILSAIVAVGTGVLVGGLLRYKVDEKKRTNGDRIRSMTDEELAWVLMCLYDTAGEPEEIMPCVRDGAGPDFTPPSHCLQCTMEWLKKRRNHMKGKNTLRDKPFDMVGF